MECQSLIRTVLCPKAPSSSSFTCSEGHCSYCGLHLVLTCSLPPGSSRLAAPWLLQHNGNPNGRASAWLTLSRDACPPQSHKACLVTSFSSLLKCEACPGCTKISYLIHRAFFLKSLIAPDMPYILLIYSLFLCVKLACMKQKFYSVLLTPRTMPFIL